ncbi:GumC family protein [Sphingomonas sp.]|uniref:GumC family protein n=1 Tax=Sphingomonas sp. TaxID=28214 RepID=UPI0035C7A5C9
MLGLFYIRLVLSRWRLVLALVVGCTLLAFLVTLYLAQKPTFTAAARLNIVPTSEELGYANRFVRGSTFDGGSTLLQTYAEFAHTRPVVAPIVDRWIAEQAQAAGQNEDAWVRANSVAPSFSPRRLYTILNYGEAPAKPLREDVVDSLIESTTIDTVEGTYLLRITVEWDDPKSAAWFANALADAIIARAERMSSKTGTQIADTLQTRLAEKQAELAAVLARSRGMKQRAGVVDVDQQKQSLLEAQIAEQSQLTSDRAALQASQSQVAGLKRQTNGKMSTAQAAIDQTLAVEAPRAAGLARGVAIRESRVAQIRAQIAALGRTEDTIRSLDDRAQQLRAEVAALTERVSFSQTENLANAPRIQLIERAVPPLTRSSPKMVLNLAMGFIAGCALAGIALLLLGPAPERVREEEAAVEPEPAPAPAPAPPAAPVDGAPPRRRWSDFVPGTTRMAETPRPYPPPGFVTSGSLALARDAEVTVEAQPGIAREPDMAEPAPEPEAPAAALETEQEEPQPTRPPLTLVPESPINDRVFGYLLPPPRNGRHYNAAEARGIGAKVAEWLGDALDADRPLTIAATGEAEGAQRLYQLIHAYRAALGAPVRTVDWSEGVRALPRGAGKPLIYAGGGFGAGTILAHNDGPILVAVAADEEDALVAEARRLANFAGRPVHVVPLGG